MQGGERQTLNYESAVLIALERFNVFVYIPNLYS